jgi:hypothetical protein
MASLLMLAAAGWFLVALRGHGAAGLAERVLTTYQSVWPLIVVLCCLNRRSDLTGRFPSGQA